MTALLGYLPESILVTNGDRWKLEGIVIIYLHIDIQGPGIIEHDTLHNLVTHGTDTR